MTMVGPGAADLRLMAAEAAEAAEAAVGVWLLAFDRDDDEPGREAAGERLVGCLERCDWPGAIGALEQLRGCLQGEQRTACELAILCLDASVSQRPEEGVAALRALLELEQPAMFSDPLQPASLQLLAQLLAGALVAPLRDRERHAEALLCALLADDDGAVDALAEEFSGGIETGRQVAGRRLLSGLRELAREPDFEVSATAAAAFETCALGDEGDALDLARDLAAGRSDAAGAILEAQLLLELDRAAEAVAVLEAAVERFPESGAAHDVLASALLRNDASPWRIVSTSFRAVAAGQGDAIHRVIPVLRALDAPLELAAALRIGERLAAPRLAEQYARELAALADDPKLAARWRGAARRHAWSRHASYGLGAYLAASLAAAVALGLGAVWSFLEAGPGWRWFALVPAFLALPFLFLTVVLSRVVAGTHGLADRFEVHQRALAAEARRSLSGRR